MGDELKPEGSCIDTRFPDGAEHGGTAETKRLDFIEAVRSDTSEGENATVDSGAQFVKVKIGAVAGF